MISPMIWQGNKLKILDQRNIPLSMDYIFCTTCREVEEHIYNLAIRGAPAIGAAAAFGMVLGARELRDFSGNKFETLFRKKALAMLKARPTAVNLSWAVSRMLKEFESLKEKNTGDIIKGLEEEALTIYHEDIEINKKIGQFGASLVSKGAFILTHCNAGALATAGYGTALGIVRKAVEQEKEIHVYVDETRPVLQGARLTAWELEQEEIPYTLITDNMAGMLMQKGNIDLVVVGADRIALNGDTANKIGTYSLAVLAKYHGVPFYVAAPFSTFDLNIKTGEEIPIEERDCREVTHIFNQRISPDGCHVFNPSFDVTPAGLISAIITEKGVIENPRENNISTFFNKMKS
ncbi:S-methyl-5-thioribose-1-phosphate isomerase [Candidatus Contubernalis alkalaceticus]|uniref:S-methyl-5-thioribose-1-phosphate isomerase n=1 Tax=Candidatus Contubernalis alkaliaceticus TaxID=338645 RepID=UPI0029622630|nr:S-methyl-5-thioribose-1-phosphate isomerase [Candidatus Contubernalis alkalaceticus]UNC92438.1 S-methyl-5-thioribose-1-phosphate isomerase [Candidatus Contubernalis alkalaceticus]